MKIKNAQIKYKFKNDDKVHYHEAIHKYKETKNKIKIDIYNKHVEMIDSRVLHKDDLEYVIIEKWFEDANECTSTGEINDRILRHKDNGFSTKGISDKWHTFDELYYHRMILFLTIQKAHIDKAWRSKQHHDGTMFEDSFIVGLDTPEGQYSYHYNLKYWELFKDIKELEYAPEYDGHMPSDIDRLLSL